MRNRRIHLNYPVNKLQLRFDDENYAIEFGDEFYKEGEEVTVQDGLNKLFTDAYNNGLADGEEKAKSKFKSFLGIT